MKICGIDEAGRGPVIGPLVICGVLINEKQESTLKKLGVKDSKLLTPKQREQIAAELKKFMKFKIEIVSPQEIDECIMGETSNLNWLEADKTIKIIEALKPGKAIIDCPSPICKKYTEYIHERLEKKIPLKGEHKADVKYLVVGAASIIAKTTRDAEIEKIKSKVGVDFGSGYMADERTKMFLERYWNKYPEVFRHSWAPFKKLAGLKTQKKLGEF